MKLTRITKGLSNQQKEEILKLEEHFKTFVPTTKEDLIRDIPRIAAFADIQNLNRFEMEKILLKYLSRATFKFFLNISHVGINLVKYTVVDEYIISITSFHMQTEGKDTYYLINNALKVDLVPPTPVVKPENKISGGVQSYLSKILKDTEEETISSLIDCAIEYEIFGVTDIKLSKQEIEIGILPYIQKVNPHYYHTVMKFLKDVYKNS